ncbi:hypothetical protein HNY73_001621 [Argiope bruennichi]|uniref:Uncharacterized protein n=1 Tax=Argiope bruennichi TaxID=94029 RepID=A0A8T0FXK3_ARGBR|nr:hypothetical protein HNY73_001621 [Argiope bruennichi]
MISIRRRYKFLAFVECGKRLLVSISFKEPVLARRTRFEKKNTSITHRIFDPIGVTFPVTPNSQTDSARVLEAGVGVLGFSIA